MFASKSFLDVHAPDPRLLSADHSLCAVGSQGYCAFFAAGLSLIAVESELRLASRDWCKGIAHSFHASARKNETGDF